ncbi:hypothetical protein KL906_004315 [Ogataea polymorpha]|nr:hypothetical protein KL906_004315 [Ogataea polymorpha]KAG7914779.1 hypothetical protein KL927_004448 [Ogataea polymorpha]KAG7931198.1 hypothetical protein KL934_004319 [Ogataea polymorpha]
MPDHSFSINFRKQTKDSYAEQASQSLFHKIDPLLLPRYADNSAWPQIPMSPSPHPIANPNPTNTNSYRCPKSLPPPHPHPWSTPSGMWSSRTELSSLVSASEPACSRPFSFSEEEHFQCGLASGSVLEEPTQREIPYSEKPVLEK